MPLVVLRCDASRSIGYGHLFRSLALARELADRGCDVRFAIDSPDAVPLINGEGFAVVPRAGSGNGMRGVELMTGLNAVVLDVRDVMPRAGIEALRARGVRVAVIDDPTDNRLSADLAFYPPVPQIEEFDWTGFTGTRLVGWEWVVLRRAFAQPPVRTEHEPPIVLVTMGGSDPAGMTLTAIAAIGKVSGSFGVRIVVGPGFVHHGDLEKLLVRLKRPTVVFERPTDMRTVMLDADLALTAFGVTAYELAATATPAIYLCLTADHARSATILERSGAAVSLGVHTGGEAPDLAEALRTLLADPERRQRMGRIGRDLVDGHGAARVAERIVSEIEK